MPNHADHFTVLEHRHGQQRAGAAVPDAAGHLGPAKAWPSHMTIRSGAVALNTSDAEPSGYRGPPYIFGAARVGERRADPAPPLEPPAVIDGNSGRIWLRRYGGVLQHGVRNTAPSSPGEIEIT